MISFNFGEYSSEVKGNSVDAALHEYKRRQGWEERHAPLCLPRVAEPVSE